MRLRKDGTLGSLFIDRKSIIPIGVWLEAECTPTKGFAVRKGFHCCYEMNAPHLKKTLSSGEVRVWAKCEVEDCTEFNRPESQGGKWILANRMRVLDIVE